MRSGVDAPAPPRVVLDTSAYSHFRAGAPRVLDAITAAELVIMPATVLGELYGAFEIGSRVRENHVALAEFLREPFVTVHPTSPSVARQYGRIYAALRRAGTPIPVNDMWIAAAAVDSGGCLITFDEDFARVKGLDCQVLSASS
jgi:tRNA(fMet)-specific endonuclease VapC